MFRVVNFGFDTWFSSKHNYLHTCFIEHCEAEYIRTKVTTVLGI